jgi:ABC-type branched-subunit amino acid transport system permease subunit
VPPLNRLLAVIAAALTTVLGIAGSPEVANVMPAAVSAVLTAALPLVIAIEHLLNHPTVTKVAAAKVPAAPSA